MWLAADFETTTKKEDCRVWAYGYMEIGQTQLTYGNNIQDFMDDIAMKSLDDNLRIYFHNLKFDGEFILSWLMNNGYEWTDARIPKQKQFTTLIGDMGQWYGITIKFAHNSHLVNIYDSLKLINFSVAEIAESFHLPIRKLEIDYEEEREPGHELTKEEIAYLSNDIEIMSLALDRLFDLGLNRMTAGSNALHSYRNLIGESEFEHWFPALSESEDEFVRKSYKGGWTYAKESIRGKEIGRGIILDVNSLYPSRMKFCPMPYGKGMYFAGKCKKDRKHPLYIQRLECEFNLKKGYLPTIQLKKNISFSPTEYLKDSRGEVVELTLTNVDLDLFLEHYEVKHLTYLDGYKYKCTNGMFDTYIDYWMNVKIQAEENGDFALRAISKLMLNSLYGKFAKRPKTRSKIPELLEGIVHLKPTDIQDIGGLYIPVGTFITSYARDYTIRSAQKNYDRFLYADTDSLHLEGTEIPAMLEVDKYDLGKWKHEGTFRRAKYLGAKCYVEDIEKEIDKILELLEKDPDALVRCNLKEKTVSTITCAGLPSKLHNDVWFEKFVTGMKVYGKLTFRHVKGGVVLEKTTFEIRKRT